MKDFEKIDRKLGKESQHLKEYCKSSEERLIDEYRRNHLDDKINEIIDIVHENPLKGKFVVSLAPNNLRIFNNIIIGRYSDENSGTLKNFLTYSCILLISSLLWIHFVKLIALLNSLGWTIFILSNLAFIFSLFNLIYVVIEILFKIKYGKIVSGIRKLIQNNTDLSVHYENSKSMKIILKKD